MATDMGSKSLCENLGAAPGEDTEESVGVYASLKLNATHVRGLARQGWCVPRQCSQTDLNNFQNLVRNLTDKAIGILPKLGIHVDTIVFNDQSQIALTFTKSDESSKEL